MTTLTYISIVTILSGEIPGSGAYRFALPVTTEVCHRGILRESQYGSTKIVKSVCAQIRSGIFASTL
jgi:hypothetical protein